MPDLINKIEQGRETNMDEQPEKPESNVIVFPGASRNRPPQSLEEICRNVEVAKTTRIEEVTEEVIINLFENLHENNYDFSERNDANKDMAFLIEALKAIMHKHDGLDHPFHALAEKYFVEDENGDLSFTHTTVVIEITEIEEDIQ